MAASVVLYPRILPKNNAFSIAHLVKREKGEIKPVKQASKEWKGT